MFVKFCQTCIWAFDKILPGIVLELLSTYKICQTSIWAFDKVLPRIVLGLLSI